VLAKFSTLFSNPTKKDQCYQNSNDIWTKRILPLDLGEREGVKVKSRKKVLADKLKQSCVQTISKHF